MSIFSSFKTLQQVISGNRFGCLQLFKRHLATKQWWPNWQSLESSQQKRLSLSHFLKPSRLANMSELRFDGKVVVVTGAGAGLGREYAHLFASRGAKVIVNDLGGNFHGEGQSRQADVVVAEIKAAGGEAVPNYDSVTDGDKIIKTALDAYGRVDVLVNNAGILRDKSFANMSDKEWDAIYEVHLKGAYVTTRAAWPVFRRQKYGRVIVTSSNSGVYGNFGQANYSAAKLGLVGFANSLAIEGAKYNIHTNVIVPTAASRMTEGILPELLFQELKPKLIAPVVVYLCHDSCDDNGSIIESAAGWATKLHIVRGKGATLRSSLMDTVTPEKVREAWSRVTDMSGARRHETINEASAGLMNVLEELQNAKPSSGAQFTDTFRFGYKDLILYALGVGASVTNEGDLRFLYENHQDFSALPTFFVQPGLMLTMSSGITQSAITHKAFDLTQVLHGEQYLEVKAPLPTEGELRSEAYVVDVLDKRSGAVVVVNCDTFDASGQLLVTTQMSTFIIGAGNFGGSKTANDKVVPTVAAPKRSPDHVLEVKTSPNQAALYRLSGDLNPMHIDPSFSAIAGFPVPILHGLCSLGLSVAAIIRHYAANDTSLFRALKVRFTKPVIPGQTLRVETWRNGTRIHFRTVVQESGQEVLSGGYVDLKSVSANPASAPSGLQSDAIFEAIKQRVKEQPEKAKSVNGVFLYKILKNGNVAKEWTLNLKTAEIIEGAQKGIKIDTTISVADEDFVDIALGKLNPQSAFMKGKLKIAGNIMLTQKLVPLLKNEAKL